MFPSLEHARRSHSLTNCRRPRVQPQTPNSVTVEIFGHNNRLHVGILQFPFIKLGYNFISSSKMTGNLPAVLNFNQLFLKLNRFICN